MKNGVVIKIKQNSAIIMADDCMFYKVKAFNGIYKGMEICFRESDIIRTKIDSKSRRYINVASLILFVLCGYLFFNFYQENYAVYAYIGIDINPSIELSLNKKEQIIGVRAIDEEGEKIVSGLNINKMKGAEGAKEIIKKAIEENYLSQDSNNEITVYTIMEKNNDTAGNEIVNKIEDAVAEEVSVNSIKGEIKTLVSDKNIKKKADNKGVSVAKYLSDDSKEVINEKKSKKDKQPEKNNMTKELNPSQKEKNRDDKDDKDKKDDRDKKDKKDDKYDKYDEHSRYDKYENELLINSINERIKTLSPDKNTKNKSDNKGESIVEYLPEGLEAVLEEKINKKNEKSPFKKDEDKQKNNNEREGKKHSRNDDDHDNYEKDYDLEKDKKEINRNKNNHNKNNKIDENKNQDIHKEKIKKEKEKDKVNNINKYK